MHYSHKIAFFFKKKKKKSMEIGLFQFRLRV